MHQAQSFLSIEWQFNGTGSQCSFPVKFSESQSRYSVRRYRMDISGDIGSATMAVMDGCMGKTIL